ncbi:MAG: hypothetical protein IT454_15130 [Planctomycetes bacterium]|nr:hypothetical protein [Planctomycetota bacterium]
MNRTLNKLLALPLFIAPVLGACTSMGTTKSEPQQVRAATLDALRRMAATLQQSQVELSGTQVTVLSTSEKFWMTIDPNALEKVGRKLGSLFEVNGKSITSDAQTTEGWAQPSPSWVKQMRTEISLELKNYFPNAEVFSDLSLDKNLEAAGIQDPLDLLTPAKLDAFREQLRKAGEPLSSIFVAKLVAEQPVRGDPDVQANVVLYYLPVEPGANNVSQNVRSGETVAWVYTGEFQSGDSPRTASGDPDRTPISGGPSPSTQGPRNDEQSDGTPAEARLISTHGFWKDSVNAVRDPADYYRIDAATDGYILVSIENRNPKDAGNSRVTAHLFDSNSKALCDTNSCSNGNTKHTKKQSLAAGSTYYIRVTPGGNVDSPVPYTLGVSYSNN